VGTDLREKTGLGVLGLGRWITGCADWESFGMNLLPEPEPDTEAAKARQQSLVSRTSCSSGPNPDDPLGVSSRTRGLVGARSLERMKPTAWLSQTVRRGRSSKRSLDRVLKTSKSPARRSTYSTLSAACVSPLPDLDNVLATPHIGYVSHVLQYVLRGYRLEYSDWLDAHQNSAGTGKTMPKKLEGMVAVITGGTAEGLG